MCVWSCVHARGGEVEWGVERRVGAMAWGGHALMRSKQMMARNRARAGAPRMLATDRWCWGVACFAEGAADVLHGRCSIQTRVRVCISSLVGRGGYGASSLRGCSLSMLCTHEAFMRWCCMTGSV